MNMQIQNQFEGLTLPIQLYDHSELNVEISKSPFKNLNIPINAWQIHLHSINIAEQNIGKKSNWYSILKIQAVLFSSSKKKVGKLTLPSKSYDVCDKNHSDS